MDKDYAEKERIEPTPKVYATASRMTAESAIKDRITKLRVEADSLEALLQSLPRELRLEADEALWRLVVGFRL